MQNDWSPPFLRIYLLLAQNRQICKHSFRFLDLSFTSISPQIKTNDISFSLRNLLYVLWLLRKHIKNRHPLIHMQILNQPPLTSNCGSGFGMKWPKLYIPYQGVRYSIFLGDRVEKSSIEFKNEVDTLQIIFVCQILCGIEKVFQRFRFNFH